MVCKAGNIFWGSVMDSPRKLTTPDNSLETVFRNKTNGLNLLTKGISSVCNWSETREAFLSRYNLDVCSAGKRSRWVIFKAVPRHLSGFETWGTFSHSGKTKRRDPGFSSRPLGWESKGEKVTYSYPTKENLFFSCQAKECQSLQMGELLRVYQQYPPPPRPGPTWKTVRWGWATGLALLQLKRGVHSEGLLLIKLIPIPVKTCTPKPSSLLLIGRTPGGI